jgi:hypothetical protein
MSENNSSNNEDVIAWSTTKNNIENHQSPTRTKLA